MVKVIPRLLLGMVKVAKLLDKDEIKDNDNDDEEDNNKDNEDED